MLGAMTRWVQIEKLDDAERPDRNPVLEVRVEDIAEIEIGMDRFGDYARFAPVPDMPHRAAVAMPAVLPWLALSQQPRTNLTRDPMLGPAPKTGPDADPENAAILLPRRSFLVLPPLEGSGQHAVASAVRSDLIAGIETPRDAVFGATLHLHDGRSAFVTAAHDLLRKALSENSGIGILNLSAVPQLGPAPARMGKPLVTPRPAPPPEP